MIRCYVITTAFSKSFNSNNQPLDLLRFIAKMQRYKKFKYFILFYSHEDNVDFGHLVRNAVAPLAPI